MSEKEVTVSIRNLPIERWIPANRHCLECGKQDVYRMQGERLAEDETFRVICPHCTASFAIRKREASPDDLLRRARIFSAIHGV